ncbi:MAG: triphosphoribosyl-dephospho-CoA synthase [Lachnospiraceae bacterium]|nr:triphosphoribosyl-dephospho-CoA synthase [Lachnospiraceae bacterium]
MQAFPCLTHSHNTIHFIYNKLFAAYAATAARTLLDASKLQSYEQLEALDDAFIARNLSPGGCADLLAVTYFLSSLQC